MTPTEEVFSRRGGVKLLLMEVEQLRSALERFQQPACSNLRTGPGNTQEVDDQILQGSKSKEQRSNDDKRACRSPPPVVGVMPKAAQVVKVSASSRARELISGIFHQRAPGSTRRMPTTAPAKEPDSEKTGSDTKEAGVNPKEAGAGPLAKETRPLGPRVSSLPSIQHTAENASGRRLSQGRIGLTRGSLQDFRTEAVWTDGPQSLPLPSAQEARQELVPVSDLPTAAAVRRSGSRRIVDHQHIMDHQHLVTIHPVGQFMTAGTAISASGGGGQGRPFTTTRSTQGPGRDSRNYPAGSEPRPLVQQPQPHAHAQQRGTRLHEVLASLPPL